MNTVYKVGDLVKVVFIVPGERVWLTITKDLGGNSEHRRYLGELDSEPIHRDYNAGMEVEFTDENVVVCDNNINNISRASEGGTGVEDVEGVEGVEGGTGVEGAETTPRRMSRGIFGSIPARCERARRSGNSIWDLNVISDDSESDSCSDEEV